MSTLAAFLSQQQVLTGMVGATLAAGALYAIRQVPAQFLAFVREHATVTLTIDSSDDVYDHVSVWLARHEKARRTRRLMMQQGYNYDTSRWGWEFTLGSGWHLLIYRRQLLLIDRHIQPVEAMDKLVGNGRRHRLTVTSIGRSQIAIRTLMEEAERAYAGDGRVQVFFYNQGGFMLADKRTARALDTVYLPAAQKQRLVARLRRFIGARAQYQRLGIPWRLGLLLEGPPGTGKTTLIFTLAGEIGRSVYVVNLNNIAGDNELMAAFNMVGPDAVIALEDVDTTNISRDRELMAQAQVVVAGVPGIAGAAEHGGVTLSGLLNAIDGIAAREGRILFMTTNHAADLDPALVRPGRVDMREVIGPLEAGDAWQMFRRFRPEGGISDFHALVDGKLPITAATLQNLLLTDQADATSMENAA